MERMNFGQMPNESVCSCGQHTGVGDWTHDQRAACYARIRDKMGDYFASDRADYLKTWEAAHGKMRYEMVHSGTCDTEIIGKHRRNEPLYAPRPINSSGPMIGGQQPPSLPWYQKG